MIIYNKLNSIKISHLNVVLTKSFTAGDDAKKVILIHILEKNYLVR